MSFHEDFVVTCGNCGGEDLEHRLETCVECDKDVCVNCAGHVFKDPDDCSCDQHPTDVHGGSCWFAVNGDDEYRRPEVQPIDVTTNTEGPKLTEIAD